MIQARRLRLALTLAVASAALLGGGLSTGSDALSVARAAQDDPAPAQQPAQDAPPKQDPAQEAPAGEAPAAEEKGAAERKLEEAVKRAMELERADAARAEEADAAARKLLDRAAERQGGLKLVPPDGKLESFQVTLHKVVFEQEKVNEDGSVTNVQVEADEGGLVLYWKGEQIRTLWSIDGKKTQRGKFARNGALVPWLHDGTAIKSLVGDDRYAKDRDQIDRDQRIVRALLDVGILRTMLSDGSRWQIIDDASYPGVALRRTPPAGKDVQLQLTLWIDKDTARVNAARLSPNADDEATMYYSFGYDDEYPKVKGDKLIFPFQFAVFEQMPVAAMREQGLLEHPPAPRKVMDGTVAEVSFNALSDSDLAPPRAAK